jgi:hypothetical protein
MTESSSHFGRKAVVGIAGVVFAILLVVLLGINIEQLLLGWIYFPLRTIPQMTTDLPSAILGTVCVLLFVAGLHFTASWFMRPADSQTSVGTNRWSWRSTLVVSATLLILFASGTAFVGGAHQGIWLLSGRRDAAAEVVTPRELGLLESVRSVARQKQTHYNLKEWGLAFHNFHDTHGAFPPGGTMAQDGELLHGWAMFVGPFHSFTAPDLDFSHGWRVTPNDSVYKCQMPIFLNPSQPGAVFDDEGFGLCHWAGNVHVLPVRTVQIDAANGSDGPGGNAPQLGGQIGGISLAQITDGTSSTILLGTVGEQFKPWGHPANVRDPALGINRSPEGFGGPPGWNGAMFLMCDGSVKFLGEDTDLGVMKALATPAGGETNPDDSALQHPE